MNTNCLDGMRCPKCQHLEPFSISVHLMVDMWDDGSEGPSSDMEWDGDSTCMCVACRFTGKVYDFQIVNQKKERENESD